MAHASDIFSNRSAIGHARSTPCRLPAVMRCDWMRTLMIHFAVSPHVLQPQVPFELDLHRGRAYVSLVAFRFEHLQPACLPNRPWARTLMRLVSDHPMLNLRTYVRHRGQRGIYFMREWLDNPISRVLGPLLYGLPYRLGQLNYRHDHERGAVQGEVIDRQTRDALRYQATLADPATLTCCKAGSLDHFLMERYIAWTYWRGIARQFEIDHDPWLQTQAKVTLQDTSLLTKTGPWFEEAEYAGSQYVPALTGVGMGPPLLTWQTRRHGM